MLAQAGMKRLLLDHIAKKKNPFFLYIILKIKQFPKHLRSVSTGAQNPMLALVNHTMKGRNIYVYIFLQP